MHQNHWKTLEKIDLIFLQTRNNLRTSYNTRTNTHEFLFFSICFIFLCDNITSMNLSIDSIMVSNKLFVAGMERDAQIAMSAKDVTTQITTCMHNLALVGAFPQFL